MARRTVTMCIEYDNRIPDRDVIRCIKDELGCFGGCMRPEDPLFTSITVTKVKLRRSP